MPTLVQISPPAGTAPGLILSEPGKLVAIPASEGQPEVLWGEIYRQELQPEWLHPQNAAGQYESIDPSLDFGSQESLIESLKGYAAKKALAEGLAEVPDGKCLHIEIWQTRRLFPPHPGGSTIPSLDYLCTPYGGERVQTYEYWHTEMPTFGCPPAEILPPAQCQGYPQKIESIDFHGATPLYTGPSFFTPICGGGIAKVIGYRDDCSSGAISQPMPINPPLAPPYIPAGVPLPAPNPPITLYGGVVENVGPGEPGYVDVVPSGDGFELNLGVPPPVLTGGTIENVESNPGYVELEPTEDGYTVNLGVPCPCTGGGEGMTPYELLTPAYDSSGKPIVDRKIVNVPGTPDDNAGPLFDSLIDTMLAIAQGWTVPVVANDVVAEVRPIPGTEDDTSGTLA